MRRSVLVLLEALLELGQLTAGLLAGGLHELVHHPVEVEVPQRAVQVVGAADRPAGLHAGVPGDGLAGQGPHHGVVALHQRLVQQLSISSSGDSESIDAAAPRPSPCCDWSWSSRHSASSSSSPSIAYCGPRRREVDLEDRLERPPVRVALHQRGRQCVLERLAVLDGDVADGLHGVQVLGQRHRQPRGPQLLDEAVEEVEHRPVPTCRRPAPWPPWRCRSGTSAGCGASPWPAGRRSSRC